MSTYLINKMDQGEYLETVEVFSDIKEALECIYFFNEVEKDNFTYEIEKQD